jgi:hypothetical protein
MRFAQYSHVPWIEWAMTASEEERAPFRDDGEVDFQRWWVRNYNDVLNAMSETCDPAGDYPPLQDLPGRWESYPPRSQEGWGALR